MLITENNRSINFNISGYQFDKLKSLGMTYDYDANWLICEIKYSEDDFSQSYSDPCLLTYELEELINAFSKILDGEDGGYISDFMEPYLKISIAKAEDKIMLIVHFVYDTSDGIWKKRKVASMVEKEYALQILNELRELQTTYPER